MPFRDILLNRFPLFYEDLISTRLHQFISIPMQLPCTHQHHSSILFLLTSWHLGDAGFFCFFFKFSIHVLSWDSSEMFVFSFFPPNCFFFYWLWFLFRKFSLFQISSLHNKCINKGIKGQELEFISITHAKVRDEVSYDISSSNSTRLDAFISWTLWNTCFCFSLVKK